MENDLLNAHQAAWDRKPVLRHLYRHWHNDMIRCLSGGVTIEIGCGIGQFKDLLPQIQTLDIVFSAWTDIVGDAQQLPVKNESIGNLVLFDVLHHIPRPLFFFSEALRVLQPQGRVVIVDPYISLLSGWVYRRFHPEPVITNCDPLLSNSPLSTDNPFDSNQAVATLIFFKHLTQWRKRFPGFKIIHRRLFSFLAYPATGGFGNRQLLPDSFIRMLHRFENLLIPLARALAFRTLVVIEKI